MPNTRTIFVWVFSFFDSAFPSALFRLRKGRLNLSKIDHPARRVPIVTFDARLLETRNAAEH